jgi:hypothetical protein
VFTTFLLSEAGHTIAFSDYNNASEAGSTIKMNYRLLTTLIRRTDAINLTLELTSKR